jgi:Dullard-like phosphatase family protein
MQLHHLDSFDKRQIETPPVVAKPDLHSEHFQQTLSVVQNLHAIDHLKDEYRYIEPVFLPDPSAELASRWLGDPKVLFLDIDETLIHCIDEKDPQTMYGQHTLRVDLKGYRSPNQELNDQPDYIDIEIIIRPGLFESLRDLSRSFQIVSFTASDSLYADTILNFLDPEGTIFTSRLYRQHCIQTNFGLVKDLRVIANRNLKDMILVDNSASSFAFNINNGIPILPFYDNLEDEELRHLAFYLSCIQETQADDVRKHNEEAFGLMRLAREHGSRRNNECSPHTLSKEYL